MSESALAISAADIFTVFALKNLHLRTFNIGHREANVTFRLMDYGTINGDFHGEMI